MDQGVLLLVVAGAVVTLIAVVVLVVALRRLVIVGRPREVTVLAGRSMFRSGGPSSSGFRYVHGGRTLRLPFVERAWALDLTPFEVELQPKAVRARDGGMLRCEGRASLRISPTEPRLDHAVTQLLGLPRDELKSIARGILEGWLRTLAAQQPAAEADRQGQSIGQRLREVGDGELESLGLEFDSLSIDVLRAVPAPRGWDPGPPAGRGGPA